MTNTNETMDNKEPWRTDEIEPETTMSADDSNSRWKLPPKDALTSLHLRNEFGRGVCV